jgi:NAD(P) transhydrogenase subunit alpha
MRIGIPKEILPNENRVAATPETVARLLALGFEVVVEKDAGAGILAGDAPYRQAGAGICDTVEDLYARSDIVLKVKQPIFNERLRRSEAEMLRPECTLITFLHPAAPGSHAVVRRLAERRITAFTMDSVPRTPRAQKMDALTSMSTITGYKAVLMAANLMPRFVPMLATAIGTVKPARILVIGTGVVGLQAVATAKRLGGLVTCVDIRPEAREEAKSLGAKIAGFDVPPELAKGPGGYARALPEAWLLQERQHLAPLLEECDIALLSALVPGEQAPVLITPDMVGRMRAGSVVVDVSVDQGGNCSATKPGAITDHSHVTIVGVQNIPGSVAQHASWLYANNLVHFIENMFKRGPESIDFDDEIVQATLVTRGGEIVHAGARKAMGLR